MSRLLLAVELAERCPVRVLSERTRPASQNGFATQSPGALHVLGPRACVVVSKTAFTKLPDASSTTGSQSPSMMNAEVHTALLPGPPTTSPLRFAGRVVDVPSALTHVAGVWLAFGFEASQPCANSFQILNRYRWPSHAGDWLGLKRARKSCVFWLVWSGVVFETEKLVDRPITWLAASNSAPSSSVSLSASLNVPPPREAVFSRSVKAVG